MNSSKEGRQPCASRHVALRAEAMEQLDRGQRGKYVNVAEAKVIVEAIDDIAMIFLQFLILKIAIGVAIISFYKAQANAIQRNFA